MDRRRFVTAICTHLVINLQSAKRLGLKIPDDLLARADKVID